MASVGLLLRRMLQTIFCISSNVRHPRSSLPVQQFKQPYIFVRATNLLVIDIRKSKPSFQTKVRLI